MIILKSLGTALIAVVAMAMLIAVSAIVALLFMSARNDAEETSIGWDPVEFGRAPFVWIIFLFVFALGFYWQYRRLVAR